MKKYDLVVIGGGPSGYAAAMRGLDYGKKVALIEKNKLGGAGIWNGALSSKTLWELSVNYKTIQMQHLGYNVFDSDLSFSSVFSEMNNAVSEKYRQLKTQVDYFVKKGNLDFYQGHGQLCSKNEISIDLGDHKETIHADYIVLAIGSRPRYLPGIPIDEENILTSNSIGKLKEFPKSMVILGAGVIGCEFATIFSNFGKTKVYLIDKADHILPFEDRDLSNIVASNLEKKGVQIHQGASLDSMRLVEDNKVEYTITVGDRKEIYTVDKALISVGRVPNIENLGCESAGIELNNRGYAVENDSKTTADNIYAVGDFTSDIALVNVGELEGRHAVEKIFGNKTEDLNYKNISTIMFLNPAIAGVGINENQCREKGIAYRMAKVNYGHLNRAIAMRRTEGFFKILVTDDDDMRVLGWRACGKHASSTIESIALLIQKNMSIRELAEIIFPHPSITEGIQECVRMLLGKSIMKPEVFNMDLHCHRVSEDGRVEHLTNFESQES